MKAEQRIWTAEKGWEKLSSAETETDFQLVFVFGASGQLKNAHHMKNLTDTYGKALIIGCSTAGEICGGRVFDDSLIVTAVRFEKTGVKNVGVEITDSEKSFQVGEKLAESLIADDLIHMFVLSDGLAVNGTDLVKGLISKLPDHIKITGGLAGDGDRFQETFVVDDGHVRKNKVVAVGFYGRHLKVGYGSLGGWDPFGPERLITRSQGNELFEMDGRSALELYKQYLGKHAEGLPATGLLFPLSLRTGENDYGVVRTILSVDRQKQSLVFAGDVPEGTYARLMKANFDRLIDGAEGAARLSRAFMGSENPCLAIMISCVGRKMILKQRIEEEVESAREILGQDAVITGFYSYGELAPSAQAVHCELHNQTMTITTFLEEI